MTIKKIFIIFFLGILIGLTPYFYNYLNHPKTNGALLKVKQEQYNLINPTVYSNINKHFIINFNPLKEQLLKIQSKYPSKTFIYFNYLNNAAWVGLNEKDLFVAASTVKVPLAMAFYKAVEEEKIKTTDTYILQESDLDASFGDLYKEGAGKEFTAEKLVEIMLEKSDNTAAVALNKIFQNLGIDDPLSDVYEFMGWEYQDYNLFPEMGGAIKYQDINLKTLSNMFLALYNASYINIEHSQQILSYLSQSSFNDQIVAGVPEEITVAHKIGFGGPDKTLSDCGIVYAPYRQYILCLGSEGLDEQTANQFMSEISRITYQFVINN